MSGTFTSWGALVQALQKEVAEATEEVVDDSLDDLYSFFSGGGSVSTGEISLNTGHGYSPSGRDTRTIYGYAENGGLLGNGGFWADTMSRIPAHIQQSFGSRFH